MSSPELVQLVFLDIGKLNPIFSVFWIDYSSLNQYDCLLFAPKGLVGDYLRAVRIKSKFCKKLRCYEEAASEVFKR